MRGAVHHIDLTARDLARSAAFYDEVLGFLGYRRSRGDATGVDWDLRDAGQLVCSIGLKPARSDRVHDRWRAGLHHLAWHAASRDDVDRLYALLVGKGACISSTHRPTIRRMAQATMPSSLPIPTGSSWNSSIGREAARMTRCCKTLRPRHRGRDRSCRRHWLLRPAGLRTRQGRGDQGPVMDQHMGIANLESPPHHPGAEGLNPRLEVQLLHFLNPPVKREGDIARLDRIGFNHICFAVSDIDGLIAKVTAAGVRLRNQPMTFHDRKLVFLEGPEGITVELAEWK